MEFQEGLKIKLNYDKILKRSGLSIPYIKFVEESKDKIFTLQTRYKNKQEDILWELKEHPEWLWFEGDLIIINKGVLLSQRGLIL